MNKKTVNLKTLKVTLVNLGCDKNRVDAEKMLYKLKNMGFKIATDIKSADLIIVNTCSFIRSATEESENSIKDVIATKKAGAKLLITGCYAERFYNEAKEKFPQADLILRLSENENLTDYIYKLYDLNIRENVKVSFDRVLSTPKHYAFLKISDGCNNFCSFCTIPYIRGRYKSEPIEKLVKEVEEMTKNGLKELILIAQDVTRYGKDLYGEIKLVELIQKLSETPVECIRLHYCYPELVDDKLIYEIVTNDKVAKYIDVPLQHINDNVLKNMKRRSDRNTIMNMLEKLKKHNITVRSTFMVGFPGETEEEFNELVEFLKEEKLKYVGFFAYSQEENTVAGKMENQVPENVKRRRLKDIQNVQKKILNEIQKNAKGSVCEAICDGFADENLYVFRAKDSSPEVDTVIYVYSEDNLEIGKYYTLKIIRKVGIDLQGELV